MIDGTTGLSAAYAIYVVNSYMLLIGMLRSANPKRLSKSASTASLFETITPRRRRWKKDFSRWLKAPNHGWPAVITVPSREIA